MSRVESWMLPDGVEEILPGEAQQIENLRHSILALFQRWGYDCIIPPMVEFTDSLLVGLGSDLDIQTFKLTDQLSGRTMGVRADMTPQAARIDAHSFVREGVNRLCYAGHVLYTRPKSVLASRSPIQVGIELFGEPSLDADVEVISLLLDTLSLVKLPEPCIDLGHVGIYRALAEVAELTAEQENTLFNLLQAKALTELDAWAKENIESAEIAKWLHELPRLSGSQAVLAKAREVFADGPSEMHVALDELEHIADTLTRRYPGVRLYFDLSELRGYHYHTGIVFAAFTAGMGHAIATGGRYDHIGEVFGRSRPATGFTADLVALKRFGATDNVETMAVFAPVSENESQWEAIQALRDKGERVICGVGAQSAPFEFQQCDRQLVEVDGEFKVQLLNSGIN